MTAAYCPSCGHHQPEVLVCRGCSYPNEANSKFCQECGLSLGVVTTPHAVPTQSFELPFPPPGITVEFPFSTSGSFDFALDEARKLASFVQFGEGKKAVHRVTVEAHDINLLLPLIEQMKGWRRRTVYVDGQKTKWDSVFAFVWCFEAKNASYQPRKYCFGYEQEWEINIWGCIRANLPFRSGAQWLTWGRWLNNNGDWEFDKQRIRHELEKKLYSVRFCPALNFDLIEAVISAIPAIVNPTKNTDWQFIHGFYGDPRPAIKMISHRYGYAEEVYVVGVEPLGTNALRDITRRAGLNLD